MNINLFTNFSLFKFKDIDHIKGQIFYIEQKFYKLIETKEKISPISLKNILVGNDRKKFLFYTGLEDKCDMLCENHLGLVNTIIKNSFSLNGYPNDFDDPIYVKIKLNITQHNEKSLLCILIISSKLIINDDKSELNYNNNSFYIINYYLFPLGFSDYHK